MAATQVLAPVFVQVALTFCLLAWMGKLRVGDVRQGRVRPGDVALRQPNWPARTTQIANAFHSQLELPVLFYLVSLLALFTVAVFSPGLGQGPAIAGFALGLAANLAVWAFLPGVSWLWWNVLGFVVAWFAAFALASLRGRDFEIDPDGVTVPRARVLQLLGMAAFILLVCLAFQGASWT